MTTDYNDYPPSFCLPFKRPLRQWIIDAWRSALWSILDANLLTHGAEAGSLSGVTRLQLLVDRVCHKTCLALPALPSTLLAGKEQLSVLQGCFGVLICQFCLFGYISSFPGRSLWWLPRMQWAYKEARASEKKIKASGHRKACWLTAYLSAWVNLHPWSWHSHKPAAATAKEKNFAQHATRWKVLG